MKQNSDTQKNQTEFKKLSEKRSAIDFEVILRNKKDTKRSIFEITG